MTAVPTNKLDYAPPPTPSLGDKTARGLVWLMLQTIILKLISSGGQIVLAWLLMPADFGLVTMAYTVTAFIGVFQQTGLKDILIHRHGSYRRWANSAFWMSLYTGIIAGVLEMGTAPMAAGIYHTHRIVGLIAVLALTAPLTQLSVVPMAKLSIDLRFRTSAQIGIWTSVGSIVLSILFAFMHFGAYSFVLPRPIIAAAQAIYLWRATMPPIRWTPQWRRWKFLIRDSTANLAWFLCLTIIGQGDFVTLGRTTSEQVLGIYAFAFNLSLQAQILFTLNLWGVLAPALSKLQDDIVRQTGAFLRAARILALVSIPFTLLQAGLSDAGIHAVFKPKWYPAIPVLQALSMGMAFAVVGAPGGSLLQAQGRFVTLMKTTAWLAGVFVVLVISGVMFDRHVSPLFGWPHNPALSVAVAVVRCLMC